MLSPVVPSVGVTEGITGSVGEIMAGRNKTSIQLENKLTVHLISQI